MIFLLYTLTLLILILVLGLRFKTNLNRTIAIKFQEQTFFLDSIITSNDFWSRGIEYDHKTDFSELENLLSVNNIHFQSTSIHSSINSARNRIEVISLIHELHYYDTTKGKNYIKVNAFLKYYLDFLKYQDFKNHLLILRLEKTSLLELPSRIAISFCLVINEIMTNCLQHAYPDVNYGKVELHLTLKSNSEIELIIRDYGAGFQLSKKNTGLGIFYIKGLCQLLRANLEFKNKNGSVVRVTLNLSEQTTLKTGKRYSIKGPFLVK